jgi:hypothetical protein
MRDHQLLDPDSTGEAGLLEEERKNEARDAAADDENAFWIGCHIYLT